VRYEARTRERLAEIQKVIESALDRAKREA